MMGRPLADIDEEKVAKLASMGVRVVQIAELLRVSTDTIRTRFGKLIEAKNMEYYTGQSPEGDRADKPHIGRPLAPIDENELAQLALKGAKNSEIAAYFGVDENTIVSRFSRVLTKKRSIRRMHLRGAQTDKALGGDTTMLIWLGKNDLDQTDKVEQQHSGGITINVIYEDIEPGEAAPESPQSRPSPLL